MEPKTLKEYDNKNYLLERILKNYNNFDELPNLLVFGNDGCGKKTVIHIILNHYANPKIYNKTLIKLDEKIKYFESKYHIEIDLNHYNLNDKYLIENFVKDFVTTRNVGFDIPKVVVFFNAHLISRVSQFMLRRIIENNYQTCKFIFSTNNLNRIIEPLKSRFLHLKIKSPTKLIMKNILKKYNKYKNLELKSKDINKANNNINIKTCIQNLELISKNIDLRQNYEIVLSDIFKEITSKKFNLSDYYDIRTKIYELYTDNNSETSMFNYLFHLALKHKKFKDEIKMNITKEVAINEQNMILGNKEPIYLEKLIFIIIKYT